MLNEPSLGYFKPAQILSNTSQESTGAYSFSHGNSAIKLIVVFKFGFEPGCNGSVIGIAICLGSLPSGSILLILNFKYAF